MSDVCRVQSDLANPQPAKLRKEVIQQEIEEQMDQGGEGLLDEDQ